MASNKVTIESVEKKLKEILREIPAISIIKTATNVKISSSFLADIKLEISINNKRKIIIVEIKSVGEPRYIRSAVQQLSFYLTKNIDAYGVIAAPYISEKTSEICKEANIGYLDFSGNCFLAFDAIYIKKENFKSVISAKKEAKSLFSKKTSRILRVLLTNPEKVWTQMNLSHEAIVSLGLANRIIKKLYNMEYVDFDQNRKILFKNPSKFLDLWRENYSYIDNGVKGLYSPLSYEEFEDRLTKYMFKKSKDRYAFTLFSGAALIAPFVRSKQTFFYFSGNLEHLKKEFEIKPVSSGANIIILTPYDEGVYYGTQKVKERNVVSNIQLYLDLYNYKGRGREQAEYLREKALKF
jgi:hypothetical protein